MSKFNAVLVIAESNSAVSELTAAAASFGEKTYLITSKEEYALNADVAYVLKDYENNNIYGYLDAIKSKVSEIKPELVLTDTSKDGRLTAAFIAAANNCSVLTDSQSVELDGTSVVSKRLVYGGAASKTEKGIGALTVVCVGSGSFEAGENTPAKEINTLEAITTEIQLVEKKPKELRSVNLGAAKAVVSVGRGIGSQENIKIARELAETIGAELACSRPVAEDEKWMESERYVGVSGTMIGPDVYLTCGISGQIQHMTGVTKAKAIFAINKDKSAPIFERCDYGIVGDLNTIIPMLTAKFKAL